VVNKEKLRILLLGDSRSFHIERYLPELRRQNCKVTLASVERGPVEHYHLKRRGPIKQLHYTLAAAQLKKLVAEYRPDIIDVQDANCGYMAALALKRSNIPLNLQILGSDILLVPRKSFLHRLKTVYALRRADAVTADSEYLLNEAEKLCPLKRTLIEPFGVEEKYLRLHKENCSISRPLKIIVPRLQDKVYNNLFIVKSLAELLQAGSITLTFQDLGLTARQFKSDVTALGFPGVHFYQRSDRDTFMNLMSQHDVYLSASLSDSSPVTLIEAMALGLIPVVADIPGVKEWAGNSAAFIYPANDSPALAAIISQIVKGDSENTEMRRRNLEKVKRRAIFENNVAARIEMMQKLVRPA